MTEQSDGARAGPTHRSVEIGVVVAIVAFALLVIVGSLQVGIGWGAEGPKAGFFPFYIGVLILISSVVNFVRIAPKTSDRQLFADWGQLRKVMSVLVPTAIYVALIPWLGIYVTSILLIAAFMRRLGRYDWSIVAAISLGVPLVIFLIFERWFLLPLPKGPIEAYLGF
jgi:putative tricarboxylic transport membrane protein